MGCFGSCATEPTQYTPSNTDAFTLTFILSNTLFAKYSTLALHAATTAAAAAEPAPPPQSAGMQRSSQEDEKPEEEEGENSIHDSMIFDALFEAH